MSLNRLLSPWLLSMLLIFGFAQARAESNNAGGWLREGISAMERIDDRRGAGDDLVTSSVFLGVIAGSLAVHRENNLAFAVLAAATKGDATSASKWLFRIGPIFTPLLYLPDSVNEKQAAAILKKYLNDNPAKWTESVSRLLTGALAQAYPQPK